MPNRRNTVLRPLLSIVFKRIRAIREERKKKGPGFSQQAVADRLGMQRAYYWKIETGRLPGLTTETIIRIAVEFGVDPGDLLPTLKEIRDYFPDGEAQETDTGSS